MERIRITLEKTAERYLSEKEKEIIARIIELPLPPIDKAHFLLVWRGLKKGAMMDLVFKEWDDYEIFQEISPQAKEGFRKEFVGICNELNLGLSLAPVETSEFAVNKNSQGKITNRFYTNHQNVFVADTQEHAMKLGNLFENLKYERADEDIIGKLLGYPVSATTAYLAVSSGSKSGKEAYEDIDQHNEIDEKIRAFANFKFSKEHWREEIEEIKLWAEEIEIIAPDLLQEIISRYRKRIRVSEK